MSKILYLGPVCLPDKCAPGALAWWLRKQGEDVFRHNYPLYKGIGVGFDWLISYGYRHVIPQKVLDLFPGRAINLHIGLLPWNRGADPNLWSWAEDTPKGVTIHQMDAGIDTGPILFQTEMNIGWEELAFESGTLRSTYEDLQATIQAAFRVTWWKIKNGSLRARRQPSGGSYHAKADLAKVQHLLDPLGWDTPVSVFDSWAADNQMSEACIEKQREETT